MKVRDAGRLSTRVLCGAVVFNGIWFYVLNDALEKNLYFTGSWYDIPYSGSFALFTAVALLGPGLLPTPETAADESYGSLDGESGHDGSAFTAHHCALRAARSAPSAPSLRLPRAGDACDHVPDGVSSVHPASPPEPRVAAHQPRAAGGIAHRSHDRIAQPTLFLGDHRSRT